MKKILIIAGEASSDMHAADLICDINQLDKEISFSGLGGKKMENAGCDMLFNIVNLAFIGPAGLFKNYFTLRNIFYSLCRKIKESPPDCAILIDYAEFNLRVAKVLKKLGIPVIYYISPQVWAWGLWRIKTIEKLVDKMLVFFKFEEELYRQHGVDATCVGHPLLDTVKITMGAAQNKSELGIEEDTRIVGLLPGSRVSEVKNMLPIMLSSSELILKRSKNKKIKFIIGLAPTMSETKIKKIISNYSIDVIIVKDSTYNAINICDCAIVTSGTATLETAILGVPMAIVYKTNFLTYILTRSVIKLPYIGLVNVVAGEKIVPEYLQYEAEPAKISEYIVGLLNDSALCDSIKSKFSDIKRSLGEPGAIARASKEVVEFLRRRN